MKGKPFLFHKAGTTAYNRGDDINSCCPSLSNVTLAINWGTFLEVKSERQTGNAWQISHTLAFRIYS